MPDSPDIDGRILTRPAPAVYLRESISNGNAREQALIRRWWHEQHKAQGCVVWEYQLAPKYADAIWFPESPEQGVEHPGQRVKTRHPIKDVGIVLCEAKAEALTSELIGQALVHKFFAGRAGARVIRTIIFAENGTPDMRAAAEALGLEVVIGRAI